MISGPDTGNVYSYVPSIEIVDDKECLVNCP
jgi:hypothetical protein